MYLPCDSPRYPCAWRHIRARLVRPCSPACLSSGTVIFALKDPEARRGMRTYRCRERGPSPNTQAGSNYLESAAANRSAAACRKSDSSPVRAPPAHAWLRNPRTHGGHPPSTSPSVGPRGSAGAGAGDRASLARVPSRGRSNRARVSLVMRRVSSPRAAMPIFW